MAENNTEGGSSTNIKAAHAFLDLLDRIKALGWRGILDGILKLLFIVCFAMGLKFIINPRPTVEYYISLQEKIQDERHQELINKRVANTPKINDELNLLQATLDVDRTFIIEFHNGTNNMAMLPFWWGDMTYEFVRNDVYGVRDNWLNISLTRYTFLTALIENNCWCGSVQDVAKIDEGFAKKLIADDVTYVAFILLYNTDGKPLGILGVANIEGHAGHIHNINNAIISRNLVKFSQIINPLLIGK